MKFQTEFNIIYWQTVAQYNPLTITIVNQLLEKQKFIISLKVFPFFNLIKCILINEFNVNWSWTLFNLIWFNLSGSCCSSRLFHYYNTCSAGCIKWWWKMQKANLKRIIAFKISLFSSDQVTKNSQQFQSFKICLYFLN